MLLLTAGAGPASRPICRRQAAATPGQLAATSHNGWKGVGMGDKGGKKDKEKNKQQQVKKQKQEEQRRQDKAKPRTP